MGMGNLVETEGRVSHLGHPVAQERDVLGGQVGVVAETHLELVERFGRQARQEDLPHPLGHVVKTLEAIHTGLHSEPRSGRGIKVREPPRAAATRGAAGSGREGDSSYRHPYSPEPRHSNHF